ncbi:hypothetical protein, partial [Novosphingobium sp.]|uniref:hypothetical protein n=1 Tax=Novosphingobium sp. TaxID=1874826 RepID=UPI0028AFF490
MSTHMTAHWSTFDLVIHCRSYPSGNQPFIPQPRKAASAPRLLSRGNGHCTLRRSVHLWQITQLLEPSST